MLFMLRSALRCNSLVLLFLLVLQLHAVPLVVDEVSLLDAIKQDNSTLYERKILVKHYMAQHRYDEASVMNRAILKRVKDDKDALKAEKKIAYERRAYALLVQNSLTDKQPSSYFFDASKASNREIYKALVYFKHQVDPQFHENMIRYYISEGQFDAAHSALGRNSQLSKISSLRLQGELAEAQKAYERADKLYKQSYQVSGELSDALSLLSLQIKQQDYAAIIFYAQLQKKFKADPKLTSYAKPIKKLKSLQFATLKAQYEKDKSIETLRPYANTLYAINKRQKAINIAADFNKHHNSDDSALFLAQLYYWNGNNSQSIRTIEAQPAPHSVELSLLLGKVYSNTKQFDKAKRMLQPLRTDENEAIVYDARKQLAYITLYEGEKEEATKEFTALLAIHKDRDIEKTLQYLNLTDEEKIIYFEKQLQTHPHDKLAKITLAQLYLKKSETHQKGIILLQENATEYQELSDYLLLAQNAYWVQENEMALAAIDKALEIEPQNEQALALRVEIEIYEADKLYFAGDYSAALNKYALLESQDLLDENTTLHQAISLENDKQYHQAEKKFTAIYTYDQRDFVLFHIAFNTLQQKEYLTAKRDFTTVVSHQQSSQEDPTIYTYAKDNLAFIEKKLNEPKSVVLANGLVMAPLVEKDLLGTEEVFGSASAKSLSSDKRQTLRGQPRVNRGALRVDYYLNRDKVKFIAIMTEYERKYLYKEWGMGADIGYFAISDPLLRTQDGTRMGITFSDKHLSLRLGINNYEGYSKFAPVVEYKNVVGSFSYLLQYAYQSAMFYTMSPQALAAEVQTNHFAFNSYLYGSERWNVWSSIAMNIHSNSNTAVIPQFDYNFYRFIFSDKFSIATSLNGWYMFNSNENDIYYSPKSYDSTLVGLRPNWIVSNYLTVNLIADVGYSFTTDSPLYNFGLNLSMDERDGFFYQVGCRESNAARNASSLTTIDYYEVECTALMEYSWH